MRAVVISDHSGPATLRVDDVPVPVPTSDQVLIEVRAAGVSFPELLQTRGMYQDSPELPFVPGLEVAGTVRQAPAASGFGEGQRVMALTGRGGLAQIAVAPAAWTFAIPGDLDDAEAAAVILNMHTAYFALTVRARLAQGETVVVHGAAGGLGTASVSIAAALGATVVGVVSTEAKAEVARRAGAHHVVVAGDDDWAAGVRAAAPGGVDVVLDPVGGSRAVDSLRVLRPLGRYVVLGFTAGQIPEIRVNRLLLRNLDVVGAGWGAYVLADPATFRSIGDAVNDFIAGGRVRPIVGHRIPLAEARSAFDLLDTRSALGKVIVEMP